MTLRCLCSLFAIGTVTFAFMGCKSSQNSAGVLFVQSTHSGSLTPVEGKKGTYTLEMHASPFVTYFTDRPQRHAGTMSTGQFLDLWNQGNDSFETDPPNAALAVASEPLKTMVFELTDPVGDKEAGTIQYTAMLVSDPYTMTQGISGTQQFGFASLFIDDYAPYNYGGYYGSPGWGGGGWGWGGERGYWPGGWHYNTIVDPGVSSQEGKTSKAVNNWIYSRTEKSRELKAQGKIPPWMPETQSE